MSHDRTAASTCFLPCPTTTISFRGRRACAAFRTCQIEGRPDTSCSTLGMLDFSLLPFPAASTTTESAGGAGFFFGKRRSFVEGSPLYRRSASLTRARAPGGGIEPPSEAPKAPVLPLDHPGRLRLWTT